MNDWIHGKGDRKRKCRTTGNEEINETVYEWFVGARAKNMPISGPILQAQALNVAAALNITTFKASTSWLDSFKARHDITFNQICGEVKDTDEVTVSEWKEKLDTLIDGYDACDIYNGDEIGLFFRALPNKSLCLRGEKCIGGKISKERMTVYLCGNMVGQMEKPMVIGKSKKPRYFKNIDSTSLPVVYRNNKKFWMTSALMTEWLTNFNNRMVKDDRKFILFLDNTTCHSHLNLTNVKLAWFPSNTSSLTQPMDQGVIYTFKSHYRRSLLQSLIPKISSCKTVNEVAKSVTILDAIYWTHAAVQKTQADTVSKCFIKAGFQDDISSQDNFNEASENVDIINNLCRQYNFPF